MPFKINAECPKCGKKAKTLYEIEELFGFRYLENAPVIRNYEGWVKPSKMKKIGKKTIPQSNCIDCRSGKTNKVIKKHRQTKMRF